MTKNESDSVGSHGEFDLADCYYPQLLRVARSAGLDLSENRKQDDLLDRLEDAGVERVGYDEFTIDGERLDLLPPQTSTSSGPKDETVLYCLPRDSTEDHIDAIRHALEENTDLVLEEAGSDGSKYAIVLPAGVEDTNDGDEYDPGEAENWVRSQGDFGEEYADEALHQNGDYFEQFDSMEEVREDFETFREIALEDMTREELYELAQDLDIDGRGDMSKSELVDAIIERQ